MEYDFVIIGAGAGGLAAARELKDQGHSMVLLDKGRGVGGRMATRRMREAEGRWDHGAQFITLRSEALQERLASWGALQSLEVWHDSPGASPHPRFRPLEGLNAFAKALAGDLEIRRSFKVTHVQRLDAGWELVAESGESVQGAQLICALPVPQLLDLFAASELPLHPPAADQLGAVDYERCLSLLVELDGPSGLEEPGFVKANTGCIDTVADNHIKGISEAHTLTVHAQRAFSREWYDRDRSVAASVLRAALNEWKEFPVKSVQIHGWKFAEAIRRVPAPFLKLDESLYACGDGFEAGDDAGVAADLHPRIESALLSGWALGKALSAS